MWENWVLTKKFYTEDADVYKSIVVMTKLYEFYF